MIKTKKAFSLIEVIFVLVILGIVASISSQIIVQVYENYITQNAIYKVGTKTELVANQIVNRLAYRVQGSTLTKAHQTFLKNRGRNNWATRDRDWLELNQLNVAVGGANTEHYTTIEWIGYDNDSFAATSTPEWSGVANYMTATRNSFVTPGSRLTDVATVISNLSKDSSGHSKVTLTRENPAAVIFANRSRVIGASLTPNNPLCMGLIQEDGNNSLACIYAVTNNGTLDTLTFTTPKPVTITERYKLAWSAYALVPEEDPITHHKELVLYSNYQPWNNENYIQHGTRHVLLTNLTVFKFSENGGVIKFKLCASERIGPDHNVSTCKEKAVIR